MTDNPSSLPSFRRFDYRIRPNKATERRMLTEAFRRLSHFAPMAQYQYVGFGSTTFTDFILFHRELDIPIMYSIESRKDYELRFDFNRPFDCVKIKYGHSNDVLPDPEINWDKRSIIWLDYDGHLDDSVLRDISYVTSRIVSGSMLLVTVNVDGYKTEANEKLDKANQRLRKKFEEKRHIELPPQIEGKHLQGDGMAKTSRYLIEDAINSALRDRNGLGTRQNELNYRSLLNVVYRDGATMGTFGGIYYNAAEEQNLQNCQFDNLKITTPEDEPFVINVPVLTPRERFFMEQRLPKGNCNEALEIGLAQEEIDNFIALYRFYPTYAEIEL